MTDVETPSPADLEAELAVIAAVPADQRTADEQARFDELLSALSAPSTPADHAATATGPAEAYGVDPGLCDAAVSDPDSVVGTVVAAVGTSEIGFPDGTVIDVDEETGVATGVRTVDEKPKPRRAAAKK